ncbi:MAG: ATP-binding protein [Vicinamibacterales bacterium]
MTLFTSLRGRIFVATAVLTLVSIGAAVLLVSLRVTRETEAATEREIRATAAVVEQLRTIQGQTFTSMARLIADAPKLKAAVDTNDPPTVQDVVRGYQDELGSNLLIVTGRAGSVLASAGLPEETALNAAERTALSAAASGREGVNILVLPHMHGLLQLVTVPITVGVAQPERLGALSVGFLFDDALAAQVKQITGSDVAFGLDGHVLSATLPDDEGAMLQRLFADASRQPSEIIRAADYIGLPVRLSSASTGGTGPIALILRSRTEQLRVLRTIRVELALTATVAVLLAILLSLLVARTITGPLATVTDAMREVAATGDLTTRIALRADTGWDDADARLLATTFNTLTESVARFQREFSQRERLSSLGRLSTVIAHEIRNPLMIIKAALHTLKRPQLDEAGVREVAEDIEEEVTRLNRLVHEVLDFARPIQFDLAPTDLNALCREATDAVRVTGPLPIQLDLDPAIPSTTSDAERLRMVFVNLLENARQAVAPTADTDTADRPLIRLRTHLNDHSVVVTLDDAGSGIAADDLPRVFDPFFTTRRGGTGLGLPIVRNIVEGLGGSIGVTSTPGAWTTFRIELPLGPPAPH